MTNNEEDRVKRIKKLLDSEAETRAEDVIQPSKAGGTTRTGNPNRTPTPEPRPIALDKDNMPLPKRVEQVDMGSTRVTPAAYETANRPRNTQPRPTNASMRRPSQPPPRRPSISLEWMKGSGGCFVRALILALFGMIIMGVIGGSVLLVSYYRIASTLPTVDDLRNRTSQFETTRILDRNGNLLYEILDPNAGRRTYVTLDKISPALIAATIATEDQDFYTHPGFDPWAIVRALWINYTTNGQGGGASTITQQLARALLLSPEERAQRTYLRKAREIILSAEITRRYSKDEILELYLNEIYYGNLSYGIEAASETYFGKTANQLNLAEASFLAGLPQSPAVYDIYTNRDVTLERQQQVLVLMFTQSQQKGCITVSNSNVPICVDQLAALDAANDIKNRTFNPPVINTRYPHWVNFVRSQLEEQYDAQTIYRSGFIVYTTLDPQLQDEAQRMVTDQVALLVDKNAHNGALVSIKPSTGEILAMVGSPDFYNDAISGQINMADSPTRQPGSSIKPITYVAAFEKGWTPSTWIWDVPTEFPDGANPPYVPKNYDDKFHGGMTVRTALSNSFNIPAVKALQYVGIYDDPNTPEKDGMIAMAERLGITSLTRPDYGLSLTLGGGEVSLLEMTSAFSVFANGGKRIPPVSILKIVDFEGNIVYEYQPREGEQVIRSEHAFLISSVLSDNNARTWMFGPNSALNLPFQVAAKTGTTNDFRDNWTMGFTPDLATGVWVGNADYTPMVNTTGLSGAAPIWSQFMQYAVPYVTNNNPSPFVPPNGVVDTVVCNTSGTEPSQWCRGGQRREYFASDQPPLPKSQDLLTRTTIDTWTGLIAGNACEDYAKEDLVMNVSDEWARKWFNTGAGRDWLDSHDMPSKPFYKPERECSSTDSRPILQFTSVGENDAITSSPLNIRGIINVTSGNLSHWRLEYGAGDDPKNWILLAEGDNKIEQAETIYNWNIENVNESRVTLRLYITKGNEFYAEKRIKLNLDLPAPTSTLTPSPTPTATLPTSTPTSTYTPVPTITFTPTVTLTPSITPIPSDTNTPIPP